jgi:hypothetical protein
MALDLHNFTWEEERLVQVETQPHHLAGIGAEIQATLDNSDCEWEDIYSAYYPCEEDGTFTFYEAESADARVARVGTYVVFECLAGEETVITNIDIDTLAPVLQLQRLAGI